MQKLCASFLCAFLLFSFSANAKTKINSVKSSVIKTVEAKTSELYFKPAITLEYSAPSMSGGGTNADFKTNNFGKQITNFENIALGFHARIHKYVGLNFNYARLDLSNTALQDYAISQKARFSMNYYNLSLLGFVPVQDNSFEFFGEAGVSRAASKLDIYTSTGNFIQEKDTKFIPFIGAGVQVYPFAKSKDTIRFSALRYLNKLSAINTDLTVVRVGYVKTF